MRFLCGFGGESPGIPDKLPMIVGLREKGIEVISEIEFAGRTRMRRCIVSRE